MTTTPKHDQKIADMTFASMYLHYLSKVRQKGRTTAALYPLIRWLTGFGESRLNL